MRNMLNDAPSGLSALPNLAMPEMRNDCVGPENTNRVVSPTFNFPFLADALSMTTSLSDWGGVPSTMWNGLSSGVSDQVVPNVGAPRPGLPTALPSLPTIWV